MPREILTDIIAKTIEKLGQRVLINLDPIFRRPFFNDEWLMPLALLFCLAVLHHILSGRNCVLKLQHRCKMQSLLPY